MGSLILSTKPDLTGLGHCSCPRFTYLGQLSCLNSTMHPAICKVTAPDLGSFLLLQLQSGEHLVRPHRLRSPLLALRVP